MKTFEEILFDVELDKEVSQALRTSRRNRKRTREEVRMSRTLLYFFFLLWLLLLLVVLLVTAIEENYHGIGQEKMSENSEFGFEEVLSGKPMDNPSASVLSYQMGHIPGDDVPASGYASLEAYLADGNKLPNEKSAQFTVTHYCGCVKCCGGWSGGSEQDAVGAAGTKLTPYYSVAVDTSIIPLGTILHDADGNEYKAEDTGSAIKGYRVDLFIGDHAEAIELGVERNVTLYWEE